MGGAGAGGGRGEADVLTKSNTPLVVSNSTPARTSLARRIPAGVPTSLAPSQISFPPSAIDAVAEGSPRTVGLGTTIVAPSTPMGNWTESSIALEFNIFQDDEIMPFGERKRPPTDLGPTLSWMSGIRLTLANPGAAGVSPTRCFHIQDPCERDMRKF